MGRRAPASIQFAQTAAHTGGAATRQERSQAATGRGIFDDRSGDAAVVGRSASMIALGKTLGNASLGTLLRGDAGRPLDSGISRAMSARFREGFGGVRVHTDGLAAASARALDAAAYTVGSDIVFGRGQYAPDSPPGRDLLAHELAHVVQQRRGTGLESSVLSAPGMRGSERSASDAAMAVSFGSDPVTVAGATALGVARETTEEQEQRSRLLKAQLGAGVPALLNPGQAALAMPVFVEFTKTGEWNAEQVLATLSSQASVPEELKDAILAGPQATAKHCVALRGRVKPPDENISNVLTSRITELTYATSRSPLQYSQLAEVAKWSAQWTPVAGATTDAKKAPQPGEAGANQGDAAATEYSAKLAANDPRIRQGDQDIGRTATDTKNDTHAGEESGNGTLIGWSFVHDPFANTVIAVRTNGTGIQYTFQVERGDGAPTITLVNTEQLSELRVKIAKRQELSAPQRAQESATGPARRKAADEKQGREARADFRAKYPGVVEKWEADVKAWQGGGRKGPRPKVPSDAKGAPYQALDHATTGCIPTPTEMFHAGGGNAKDGFPFTPPINWKSWRSLATNPEGPKLGDVYYLYDRAQHRGAHMGVVKSRTPVPGQTELETWVVTDGGQGGYDKTQLEQERTRGPYNRKTGIFSSSIAEAGQSKGDRELTGWVDVDAFQAEHETPVSGQAVRSNR